MNEKGSSILIILIIIIAILSAVIIGGTFFYLGKANPSQNIVQNSGDSDQAAGITKVENKSPVPAPSVDQMFGEYKKRFVSEEDMLIASLKYPEEMFRVNENGLMNISCSVGISEENNSFVYYDDKTGKTIEIKDQFLLETARKAREKAGDSIVYAQVCKLQDGRAVVMYEVDGGGGGSLNRVYFGELSQAGNFEQIAVVTNDGSPYFGCSQILQFNLANMLWARCGGGDGGYSSGSVYRVDYHSKTSSLVVKCESTSELDANGNYTEKCL